MKNKFLRIGLSSTPEKAGNNDGTGGNEFCFNFDYGKGSGSGSAYEESKGSYQSWISFDSPKIDVKANTGGSREAKGNEDCTGGIKF